MGVTCATMDTFAGHDTVDVAVRLRGGIRISDLSENELSLVKLVLSSVVKVAFGNEYVRKASTVVVATSESASHKTTRSTDTTATVSLLTKVTPLPPELEGVENSRSKPADESQMSQDTCNQAF